MNPDSKSPPTTAARPATPPGQPACATPSWSRRTFLGRAGLGAAAGLAAGGGLFRPGRAPAVAAAGSANERVRVAVVGLARGMGHVRSFLQIPGVEVAGLCDIDSNRLAAGVKAVEEHDNGGTPLAVADFRKLLEDDSIDAIAIATTNFTHAPFTMMACEAGKHVYVEKPGSWSAEEAGWIVRSARRHDRRVQMGNQRRSLPAIREAMQRLHEGAIGPVRSARCYYNSARGSIGRGRETTPPDHMDFELWQGPVPAVPYRDNLVHYNWHWFWNWGNGELGNNGVHALDLARWGLGVDLPAVTSCVGGRYHFDDDQETPDTALASYDFGHCSAIWDGSSCHRRRSEDPPFVAFYGQEGQTLEIAGAGYILYDENGDEIERQQPSFSDLPHFTNFIDGIRDGAVLHAEIEDAQRAALMCHYGNIAYRTGTVVHTDPDTGAMIDATDEARALWGRDSYREGWLPEVGDG